MWRSPRLTPCLLVVALQFAAVCGSVVENPRQQPGTARGEILIQCSDQDARFPAVLRMIHGLDIVDLVVARFKIAIPAVTLDVSASARRSLAPLHCPFAMMVTLESTLQSHATRLQI